MNENHFVSKSIHGMIVEGVDKWNNRHSPWLRILDVAERLARTNFDGRNLSVIKSAFGWLFGSADLSCPIDKGKSPDIIVT